MAYDLADTITLSVQTKDSTGAPANAGSISLTITHVATSTIYTQPAIAISNPSTGVYQASFSPSLSGYYTVRWVATGANLSGYSDIFQVYDATPSYLVSLADMRSALRLTATTQDEDLRPYIEAATSIIERHLNEVVAPRTIIEDYETVQAGRWGNSLSLRQLPILSVTSIISVLGANLITWNASDFHIDKLTGEITTLPSTAGLFGDVTITYVAGYAVIPANYQLAAKIIVQHLWQTRRGAAGTATPGGMADSMHLSGRLGWGYAIPNAALELLGYGIAGIA